MRARAAAVSAALAAVLMLAACAPLQVACSTIGYVYTDPVDVEIPPTLGGDATVAACIGTACDPVPIIVAAGDGTWQMPAEPSYTPHGAIGIAPGDGIRLVLTTTTGEIVRDEWIEIPYTALSDRSCPGPVEFQPVVVD